MLTRGIQEGPKKGNKRATKRFSVLRLWESSRVHAHPQKGGGAQNLALPAVFEAVAPPFVSAREIDFACSMVPQVTLLELVVGLRNQEKRKEKEKKAYLGHNIVL